MGDQVIDSWMPENTVEVKSTKHGEERQVEMLDALATRCSKSGKLAISLVNKYANNIQTIDIELPGGYNLEMMMSLRGGSPDDYNDIDRENVVPEDLTNSVVQENGRLRVSVSPHSVNILVLQP
ncbi:MAG: hypothetical protein IK140_05840 [Clostridia bacterium]|nr:hypothetical protein [Clostridia bacterium]